MSIQNLTLIVAGAINLIMSILVFSRGVRHSKINLYFSLFTFFGFLWAISLLLSKSFFFDLSAEISYRTAYLAAIGIAMALFYFSYNFPYKNKNLNIYYQIFIILLAIIISVLVYSKVHIIDFYDGRNASDWFVNYYKPFYTFYSLFFFYIIFSGMYFLINKLKNIDTFLKKQIIIFLITFILGLIIGAYFNLLLPYLENWRYEFVGPICVVFMNIYVFNLIFPKQEK
jgi:hypothetical protein